jgi:hypothetical protein
MQHNHDTPQQVHQQRWRKQQQPWRAFAGPMSSKNSTARQECASKVARATITELTVGKGGNIDLFPVLLSYQYLYMRTRGHEVLTRSSTTQLISAPANERSTAQKYRLLWQRFAIWHPKASQEFYSLSL